MGVSFSPDGKMLATASADNTVKLWDTATGQVIKTRLGIQTGLGRQLQPEWQNAGNC
jgi:WD40 repeat protein